MDFKIDSSYFTILNMIWAQRLGGAESLGISKAGQTMLARLMESQTCQQPASSKSLQGEGSEKRKWPLLALMPDTSDSPDMPLMPFNLPPQVWSSERVSLSRGVHVWVL